MSNSNNPANSRTIRVPALARVEGEGALHIDMRDGKVDTVRLDIYEPPRFFEAFLRGRDFREVPDITARICGICPVAYQMSSCHALEIAMGVARQIDPPIRTMRNLLYCGEYIESHVLHMFMLHLPDFLGYESVISMAADHAPAVKHALRLKKLGNHIVATLAGRSVHPVGVCVGGFYSLPSREKLLELLPEVRAGRDLMCELALFLVQNVEFPDLDIDYEFLALTPHDEYPMNLGPITSNKGLHIDQEDYLNAIEEKQVPHSTAFHALVKGRGPYHVGPLARLNLNADKLHPIAANILKKTCDILGRNLPWQNSFLSLPARAIETVHALALSADIIEHYSAPPRPRIPIEPRAGVGSAATEAPRGILFHQYRTHADGSIASARIIPPTSQNQAQIEHDLRQLAQTLANTPDDQATLRCEHLIRNYDPCISCSVHFLKLNRTWTR